MEFVPHPRWPGWDRLLEIGPSSWHVEGILQWDIISEIFVLGSGLSLSEDCVSRESWGVGVSQIVELKHGVLLHSEWNDKLEKFLLLKDSIGI